MDTGSRLHEDVAVRLSSTQDDGDWDPFVVWRRRVEAGDDKQIGQTDSPDRDDWSPFRVWADNFNEDGNQP